MAFDVKGVTMLRATDNLRWYSYTTPDALGAVGVARYFDRLDGARSNDLVSVQASDANALLRVTRDVTGATTVATA